MNPIKFLETRDFLENRETADNRRLPIIRELLKKEMDAIPDGYLEVLYKIVKALQPQPKAANDDLSEWRVFVSETYGSLADDPIERGEQGTYEIREAFE